MIAALLFALQLALQLPPAPIVAPRPPWRLLQAWERSTWRRVR